MTDKDFLVVARKMQQLVLEKQNLQEILSKEERWLKMAICVNGKLPIYYTNDDATLEDIDKVFNCTEPDIERPSTFHWLYDSENNITKTTTEYSDGNETVKLEIY